jgi:NAD(P)H-dependent FMN reductase
MKFLAIVGSMRASSSKAALVRAAARLAPPGAGIEIYDGVATSLRSGLARLAELAGNGREPDRKPIALAPIDRGHLPIK